VSYEIHSETPPEGVLLERLFGPGRAERQESMRRRCTELDLPFEAPQLLSNSRLAVEAAEFARDAGKHHLFHRATLGAYFARSQDIGDLDVLSELAAQVDLDTAALRQALAAGRYAGRRQAAHQEARTLGITGVPTFIFAEGSRVVGAQPLDDFRRLLEGFAANGGRQ
jgi:predicted DsbA family dithiol-disulfide isomerase